MPSTNRLFPSLPAGSRANWQDYSTFPSTAHSNDYITKDTFFIEILFYIYYYLIFLKMIAFALFLGLFFNENTTWKGGIINQPCRRFPQQTSSEHKAVAVSLTHTRSSVQRVPPFSDFQYISHCQLRLQCLSPWVPYYHSPAFLPTSQTIPFLARGSVAK